MRVACRSGAQDLRLADIPGDAFGLCAGTSRVIKGLPLGTQCRAIDVLLAALSHTSEHPGPILTFFDGYHGRSLATMAASWPHPGGEFVRMLAQFVRVPNPRTYRPAAGADPEQDAERCAELLQETIRRGTQGKSPALMMEPVFGNGGQQDYPAEFYRRVREICDAEDVLLIVDEVQTGGGRGGTMWACDHYGLRPDIVVWGNGFGGGFPPGRRAAARGPARLRGR